MVNRKAVYYWKCDRPSAFYALGKNVDPDESGKISEYLTELLVQKFGHENFTLNAAGGQGNHITYLAAYNNETYFIRLENGPENDDYMEVEGRIMEEALKLGVPVPKIYDADTTRTMAPFAYQIMEFMDYPDLNSLHKKKQLDILKIAGDIGRNLAAWQSISAPGYGPFNAEMLHGTGKLEGLHGLYQEYFFLNLDKHLKFLVSRNFLLPEEARELLAVIEANHGYLLLKKGCLVHKDLALWNILGESREIKAFIDWDDAIVGDPADDLSLLACFHSNKVVEEALRGYSEVKSLPDDFFPRFYLHLLRNMIVKAVIRIGANYFHKADDFFLIEAGSAGSSLEKITRERIFLAYKMLKKKAAKIEL